MHDDGAEVRRTAHERLAYYLRAPFYQEMFVAAGYPEARQGTLTDAMLDAVVVHGDEASVGRQLGAYFDAGMDEVVASVLVVGPDNRASMERTMKAVAAL